MPARRTPFSRFESHPTRSSSVALADRAYDELKRRILTCRLAPGGTLKEKSLAVELGVTPECVREACRRLAGEHLVHQRESGPLTVTRFTLADIRELSELRRIVETKSAALAAERARHDQVARLLAAAELNYQPGERKTYENYLRTNSAFHRQLARTAQNGWLEAAVVSILEQIQRPLYLGLDMGLDAEEATVEHLLIVDAVRRKRPALAARLMGKQILAAEERMIEAFGNSGFA